MKKFSLFIVLPISSINCAVSSTLDQAALNCSQKLEILQSAVNKAEQWVEWVKDKPRGRGMRYEEFKSLMGYIDDWVKEGIVKADQDKK